MRLPFLSVGILFFFSIFLTPPAHGQSPLDTPLNYALHQYHSYLNPETSFYRGNQYAVYDFQLKKGHPYFDEKRMYNGQVWYDGILYEKVSLALDLVQGTLITNDPYDFYKIVLFTGLVDSFTLEEHFFIHLKDSLNPSAPRNGFYEQLYRGRVLLLKREHKVIEQDLSSVQEGVQHYISHTVSYYLKNGTVYYPVNNERELLYALKDRNKEVKKFIRSQKLSVKKDKENSLIKALAWYDKN
jgi:hypothetical protein